ncbi:hypothetical protein [Legionella jordanis]|uniref:Uncharacterized protein n=1 Tax=Legionella jordanis TaxID=456 RepID=A0A0W0VB39_9GAMM|nr:hypothetical protein [Legionella jordanis]KTD17340.1 hypothetical protein Ljor_1646 [Legionella jordanis]RMX01893.1 hypothetical protein EAW55_10340 [Legionella jordanis]VEH11643.1 Uncharacterised protein [Legionella jordanis]
MPSVLDSYIERLRGGDIASFLSYPNELIKKYGNILAQKPELMSLATLHELLISDKVQELDLVAAFNMQMLMEQLREQCSPNGNVMHSKADRFYNTAIGRLQKFISHLEDVLLYKHYKKDELIEHLRQENFLLSEPTINKLREENRVSRDEVYQYKASLNIPRSRDIENYKQANAGYKTYVQRFRNKLIHCALDDSFNEAERDSFSQIYYGDSTTIPRKWQHYVEIVKAFLDKAPTQSSFTLFKHSNTAFPKVLKEKFISLLEDAKIRNQQLAVMLALLTALKCSNLSTLAEALAVQLGFKNLVGLKTELDLMMQRLDSVMRDSITPLVIELADPKQSAVELKKDLKRLSKVARFPEEVKQSQDNQSSLKETHISQEDHHRIIAIMAEIEGGESTNEKLFKNIAGLIHELNRQSQDKNSNEYQLCLFIIRVMQQHPETSHLTTNEQNSIFLYVRDKFTKKLSATQMNALLMLKQDDLAVQIGKKLSNYFNRPTPALYAEFTTEVYPNIRDYIEQSNFKDQFNHFGFIYLGPLTEYLKTSYLAEDFDPKHLGEFMITQVNQFFASKADGILEKYLRSMMRQLLHDHLEDMRIVNPLGETIELDNSMKAQIEAAFMSHIDKLPDYQFKELKSFMLMIKPERAIPYFQQKVNNGINQFLRKHQPDLLDVEEAREMKP